MRLICPNCSAQYEIDVTLIPDEGRDVQCSNCGHTWFELPPPPEPAELAPAPDDAPEPEDFDEPELDQTPKDEDTAPKEDRSQHEPSQAAKAIAAATDDVSDGSERQDPTVEDRVESEPFKDIEDPFEAAESEFLQEAASDSKSAADDKDDFEDENEDDMSSDIAAITTTTLKARRPADAADVDLLREEAARELSQRRAPPSESLESQTDLGLDEISNRSTPSRALRARMARSSGDNTFEDTDTGSEADYQAPQRDLLPDIDEINSTLRQNDATADQASTSRGGFRLGFGIMLLLSFAVIIAYAFAPVLANAIPDAEGALIRFVDLANQLRDWIDGLLA